MLGNRPLVAEVLRSSRQFGGLGSHLQVVVEASASSLPSFLHSSGRSLGQVDSGEPGDQVLMQGMGLSFSSSRGGTFCSPFAFSGGYHGCLYKGMGGGSSSSTSCVRGVVEDRGLDSLHLLRVEDGASHFSVPRVSCRGSFGYDSFSLFDRSVLHLLSGRESLLVPVLADLGPVGMVSSKDNLPSDGSHSRRREFCGGLPLQGEVSSFGVVSEPLRFQNIFPVSSPPPEIVLFASAKFMMA